jgi:RNA polymerase sigma-70 factor (ECF subfamily)
MNIQEEPKPDTGENLTDAQLLERFRQGHESAFRELVNRYKNSLYAFLRRFINQQDLVEDVFQDTFLQLFTSRDSFDSERPLRPWLFTIAANKAKDALRKIHRQNSVEMGTIAESGEVSLDEVVNLLSSYNSTPDNDLTRDETAKKVREIISNMPENLRAILILAYFEQFSYKQMAEILSIPIGTVKSRLHTAVSYFTKKWKTSSKTQEDSSFL